MSDRSFWVQSRRVTRWLLGPCLLLLFWTIVTSGGYVPSYLLPSPFAVLRAAWEFVFGGPGSGPYVGTFSKQASASAMRVLAGFLIAAAIGVPAGLLSGRLNTFAELTDPLLQLIRSVPGITWLPIAMVWFGIGTVTTVFLIALASFFPIYINTLHGARAIPERWIRAGQMLGASPFQLWWRVILPATFPSIEAGLRIALGVAWAYVVLGELTGVREGLGAMIMDARMMGDVKIIIVGMIFIALLGRLSDKLLMTLLHRIPGHRKT